MKRRFGTLMLVFALLGLPANAAAQGPHSPDNREACTLCHANQPASFEDVEGARPLQRQTVHELCTTCHEWSPTRDHPVGRPVVSTPDPEGLLPTDPEGKMDCLTCHLPHNQGLHKAMLRMEPDRICMVCHGDK